MPRKSKRQPQVVGCAAHGQRCALGGGSRYVSERCGPFKASVTVETRQERELRELLDRAAWSVMAEQEGVTVEQVAARELAERESVAQAALRRRAGLSCAQLDAEDRHAEQELLDLLEQAKADNVAREAAIIALEHV